MIFEEIFLRHAKIHIFVSAEDKKEKSNAFCLEDITFYCADRFCKELSSQAKVQAKPTRLAIKPVLPPLPRASSCCWPQSPALGSLLRE